MYITLVQMMQSDWLCLNQLKCLNEMKLSQFLVDNLKLCVHNYVFKYELITENGGSSPDTAP